MGGGDNGASLSLEWDAVQAVLLGECKFHFFSYYHLHPFHFVARKNFEASKNLINQISHLGDRCVARLVCCCGNREVAKRGCHVHLTMSNDQHQLQLSLCNVCVCVTCVTCVTCVCDVCVCV